MMRHSFAPAIAAVACLVAVACSDRTADAQALDRYCSATNPDRVLLVIDQSEWFDDTDRARLFEGVNKMYSENHFPPGAQLLAFPITDRPGTLTPDLKLCVPTCETQSGDQDCDDPLVRRDRAIYQRALRDLLTSYARPPTEQERKLGDRASGSEIVRTLSNLSREYEGRNVSALYVFSDMLEYSDLNQSIPGFSSRGADRLLDKTKRRALPGKAFKDSKVRVFGLGKRLGQGWLEEKRNATIARNEQMKANSSRAIKEDVDPDPVLDNDIAGYFSKFWFRYFALAGVRDVEIKLNYE